MHGLMEWDLKDEPQHNSTPGQLPPNSGPLPSHSFSIAPTGLRPQADETILTIPGAPGEQDPNLGHGNVHVPPFLTKTYEMVNDPDTDDTIRWSGDSSFVVCDPAKFAVTLLPCYFKHNNLSSFVRQLNIYGFRKVAGSESWEFANMSFRRGNPSKLSEIKRRKAQMKEEKLDSEHRLGLMNQSPSLSQLQSLTTQELLKNQQQLVNEVCRLRDQQQTVQNMLDDTLNELRESRKHQHRTQQAVENMMAIVSSVLNNNELSFNPGTMLGKRKAQFQLTPQEGATCTERPEQGWQPVIEDNVDVTQEIPDQLVKEILDSPSLQGGLEGVQWSPSLLNANTSTNNLASHAANNDVTNQFLPT